MFDRPPDRPLLIFDGDCSFCRVWVEYWQQITADRVLYAPYQEAGDCFPDIPRQQFKAAVQLVLPDGKLFGGAHAVPANGKLGGRPHKNQPAERQLKLFTQDSP